MRDEQQQKLLCVCFFIGVYTGSKRDHPILLSSLSGSLPPVPLLAIWAALRNPHAQWRHLGLYGVAYGVGFFAGHSLKNVLQGVAGLEP